VEPAVNGEPRYEFEYSDRQVEAARRVLVDIGQVLAAYADAMVLVGGWVPDLLLRGADHIGSMDVDLALDVERLADGRYAELVKQLLDTRRYKPGTKLFQLVTTVDLDDGERPIQVEVEFLAASDVPLKKNRPPLVDAFRVHQFPACEVAFANPEIVDVTGPMISGAANTVRLRVASLSDFLILKAHAIAGRDKPKDVYDLCFCLDEYPGGIEALAANWRSRRGERFVDASIAILAEKFKVVGSLRAAATRGLPSVRQPGRRAHPRAPRVRAGAEAACARTERRRLMCPVNSGNLASCSSLTGSNNLNAPS
jgi:hypothetical protein